MKLRFLLPLLLAASPALAQPTTTKPPSNMILSPCGTNVPLVGGGSGVQIGCWATGALGSAATVGLPIAAINGGTGQTSLTANSVLLGNGTSAVAFATIGTGGRMLLDQGSSANPAFTAMSGDGTLTSGGVFALANIPSGTTMAGSILSTNIVAPGTPASGKTSLYVDSTQKVLSSKNDAGTVSITVVPNAGSANNFVTALSAAGVLSTARPTCANLSDSAASCATNATNATNITSGTLVVNVGGTGATTFTSNLPLIGNTTGPLAQGTVSGNTTKFATVTGAFTPGDCVSIDASGNVVAAGGACTTGGGGGTVGAGTTGQIAVYSGVGTVVIGGNITSSLTAGTNISITGTTNATIGLTSASTTVAGQTCTLGSSCSLAAADITGVASLTGTETLTNKTLTAPKIASGGYLADANGNELVIFTTTASAVNEITYANAATGNNPTITASGGDANVGITLTGKGTKGVTIGNAFTETRFALTDGGAPALDASLGNVFTLVTTTNPTIAVPTNPAVGQKIVIRVNASGGSRTVSLNTGANGFRFGSDITGLTATASGKTDYIGAIWNSTDSKWDVVAYVKGF